MISFVRKTSYLAYLMGFIYYGRVRVLVADSFQWPTTPNIFSLVNAIMKRFLLYDYVYEKQSVHIDFEAL